MARLQTLLASTLTFFLLLQGVVNAQDIGQLPLCARSCAITAGTATGCALTDVVCLCTAKSFMIATLQCSMRTCSAGDQRSATEVFAKICNAVNTSSSSVSTNSSSTATPSPLTTTLGPPTTSITSATSVISGTSTTPTTSPSSTLQSTSTSSSSIPPIPTTSAQTMTPPSRTLSIPPSGTAVLPSPSTSDTVPMINAAAPAVDAEEWVAAMMGAMVLGVVALL